MKIACIVTNGFEDSELRIPVDRLRQAGHEVDIISLERGDQLVGEKGKEKVTADKGIADAKVGDYDALLIPGGYSPDKLRADKRFVEIVKDFDKAEKPIAAVCHGPQLLITAELVKGRKLTAWTTIQGDLRQVGAHVEDREVVADRNWITSRKPADLEIFSRTFIEKLSQLPRK